MSDPFLSIREHLARAIDALQVIAPRADRLRVTAQQQVDDATAVREAAVRASEQIGRAALVLRDHVKGGQ